MLNLSALTTESRNTSTNELDSMSAFEIVSIMNREDRNVPEAIGKVLPQIARAAELAAQAVMNGGRLIYVGAGTSGRLGTLDAVECVPTFGTREDQVIALIAGGSNAFTHAVEGAEDDEASGVQDMKNIPLQEKDFVVGIAASGRTPYVCAALKYAGSIGCHTAAVICNSGSEMGRLAEAQYSSNPASSRFTSMDAAEAMARGERFALSSAACTARRMFSAGVLRLQPTPRCRMRGMSASVLSKGAMFRQEIARPQSPFSPG